MVNPRGKRSGSKNSRPRAASPKTLLPTSQKRKTSDIKKSGAKPGHFYVHASVVFQLGESLISDRAQALIELVKNSYDADATYAEVKIETRKSYGKRSAYPKAKGYISIEDDGVGMDNRSVTNGWLTISNSFKREFKKKERTTKRGRTPLGDKGLGRLGTQRLGHNLEIFTRPEGSSIEYHVALSWKDFINTADLSQVPVQIKKLPARMKKGTKLVISDLREPDYWTKNANQVLQEDLSKLISPYQEVRDFVILPSVNDVPLDLTQISDKIRDTAQINYTLDFDGDKLIVRGKSRLSFFKPDKEDEQQQFKLLVEDDNGDSFFNHLISKRKAALLRLERSRKSGWFVEYEFEQKLDDLGTLHHVRRDSDQKNIDSNGLPAKSDKKGEDAAVVKDEKEEVPANPGPFHGEIDSFNLGQQSTAEQSVFEGASEYRKYITTLSGVRVYRDGFGIRVDGDWLGLGQQWTSARSYYGLKPGNTMGFIAISTKDNAQLEEKTDREGFKVTPYYENFLLLIDKFVHFSGEAQQFIRREWLKFRNQNQEKTAKVENITPEALSRTITLSLSKAVDFEQQLDELRKKQEQTAADVKAKLGTVKAALSDNSKLHREIQSAVNTFESNTKSAVRAIGKLEHFLHEVSDTHLKVEVLGHHITGLRDQINQVYQTIGLGLTAEALSHEIHNIADQIASRTTQISDYIDNRNGDSKLVSYTEYINSSVQALRKQLSHLAPSLKYVREKKDKIALGKFLKDNIVGYFSSVRFEKRHIGVDVRIRRDFSVLMNMGKLTQVIDNLFLNSEYWLQEDLRRKYIKRGLITVEISRPFLRVHDNGRGIDRSVESGLFEPFVTRKPPGVGRGLGLFIVRQLLDSDGCTITVLPNRNQYGRLHVFEINFTGALKENGRPS